MAKIVKNTTGSDIEVAQAGLTIPASSSYTIEIDEHTLWASDDVITEITADVTAGNLVINDGLNDLSATAGLNFLRYPDFAFNVRFLSEPERSNCFASKTVQEAIEEARTGISPVAATTTVDATPTVAYSAVLEDDAVYVFDARVTAQGISSLLHAGFQQEVTVRRASGGGATIVGDIYQKKACREVAASGTEVCWDVAGNNVQLKVFGLAATTIEWHPSIEFSKKCG